MFLFVLAQAAVAAVAPAGAAETSGVVSFAPAYFAALNPNNASDMLARLPGFSLDNGSNVRGFEGSAGNALIDGQRPSSKSDSLDSILQRIPASKVERIDLIRGGAPGIDMQGKTVIANVILKKGGGTRGLAALSSYTLRNGRKFLGGRLEASGSFGEIPWEVSLRAGSGPDDSVSTGLSRTTFANGMPSELAKLQAEGEDINGSVTGSIETPLLGGRLRINGRYAQDKFKEPETDTLLAPRASIETFVSTSHTADSEMGGRFTHALGPSANIELVALATRRDRDSDSTSLVSGSFSDFFSHPKSGENILRGVVKRRFGETISAELGAETVNNRLESRTRYVVDGATQVLPAANVRVEERRTEIFAKGTWRPLASLTLDGVLRYETSDISSQGDVVLAKSLQYAKPRLAVTWQAVPATQIRLRLERSVGQLDFNDFIASSNLVSAVGVTAGNPNLNPRKAGVSELAIEQQLWAGASLLLTGRQLKLTDVVDRGPVFATDGTVLDTPTNIGNGTEKDVSLDFTLPFNALGWKGATLKGEVVRRWSDVRDPTTGERRRISGQHRNDWNVSFSQDLPRQKLSLGFDLYGGFRRDIYRFNLIENVKVQTYVRPYAEWKPTSDWSLRVELPLITEPNVRFRDTYQVFPGPRSAGGQPDITDRQFTFPRGLYLRLLRNLG